MRPSQDLDLGDDDELRPLDRRTLAHPGDEKSSKWPRTDRRRQRIESVLHRRQPDLTVVLENVHDAHNAAAVLRSCEAVGIATIHLVYTLEDPPKKAFGRRASASAAKWIDCVYHESIEECYEALRADGFEIVATSLEGRSHSYFNHDYTVPTAIVLGNEMRGLTDEAVELADASVYMPMAGMVQSLNISVACAVTLFEAFRQRLADGQYDTPKYAESFIDSAVEEWLRR